MAFIKAISSAIGNTVYGAASGVGRLGDRTVRVITGTFSAIKNLVGGIFNAIGSLFHKKTNI